MCLVGGAAHGAVVWLSITGPVSQNACRLKVAPVVDPKVTAIAPHHVVFGGPPHLQMPRHCHSKMLQ